MRCSKCNFIIPDSEPKCWHCGFENEKEKEKGVFMHLKEEGFFRFISKIITNEKKLWDSDNKYKKYDNPLLLIIVFFGLVILVLLMQDSALKKYLRINDCQVYKEMRYGIIVTKKNNEDKYGLYHTSDKINPIYDEIRDMKDNMIAVRRGDKWGFVEVVMGRGTGRGGGLKVIRFDTFLHHPKYDRVFDFENGRAQVVLNGSWFYINKKGQMVKVK